MENNIKSKVDRANEILEQHEPQDISVDTYSGYYGYKPQYIIMAMNEAFGYGGWSFEEKEMKIAGENTLAICNVSVSIVGIECPVTAWGQSRITKGDIGDAMKGAQTDALKKALSYFDIGQKAYFGKLESKEEPKTPTYHKQLPTQPVTQGQLNELGNCKDCGAKNAWSATKNKPYCSAKCWLKKAVPQELPTVHVGDDMNFDNIPF